MKFFLILFLILMGNEFLCAQVYEQWVARYNGTANGSDGATSLVLDSLGNVYITGVTSNVGSEGDYLTIKYNPEGEEQWVRTYNGTANLIDVATDIAIDNQNNIYVTGGSQNTNTDFDYTTLKYNAQGVVQWIKNYNDTADSSDYAIAIEVDVAGDVFITGYSMKSGSDAHDITTIKYNSAGFQQWVRRYDGAGNGADFPRAMVLDNYGNILIIGITYNGFDNDFVTIKYNSAGVQMWAQVYDGSLSDEPKSIAIDELDNVYVTGGSDGDFITIKYAASGSMEWVKTFKAQANGNYSASGVTTDEIGNAYVTGDGGISSVDIFTIKYNSAGIIEWVQSYDGVLTDRARSICVDQSGNVYVGGWSIGNGSLSDLLTVSYNSDGNLNWVKRYNGPANSSDNFSSMFIDRNSNVYVAGSSVGIGTSSDCVTIKYSDRYPIFIVPGIAGTYASDVGNDIDFILNRGVFPSELQVDPLAKVYTDLITTLENVGYEQGKDLFIVNYDWRLTPGPIDNTIDGYINGISASSIVDEQYNYGVDYLGWYIKQTCERWRADYNQELEYINVIAHSTGGLVARTYIQSNSYGGVYDVANNFKLPKINNFIMIGVPNRGASKAWNPLHDNWIADNAYKFVLSKIINRAYQKVLAGNVISGPDYNISLGTIIDPSGNPDSIKFINQFVPTIRYLLATYDFIDFGNGLTNVNNDPNLRNTFVLDLNDGFDLNSSSNPNKFLDSAKVTIIYGTGEKTAVNVVQHTDFELGAIHHFTDWGPSNASGGSIWYKDISIDNSGDGTVPTISSVGQFIGDNRATLISFESGDHTKLVSKPEVQTTILNILGIPFDQGQISTGSSLSFSNIWNVIDDPVNLFLKDGSGRRLGYSDSTGVLTEIPNSLWFGNADGFGYVFGSVEEPVTIQLVGRGENYYVVVGGEEVTKYGGVVLEGFLQQGEIINYQIEMNPVLVENIDNLSPENFYLFQNYPNPFNPATTIQYSIPQRSLVSLKVYDVLGNEVANLVNEFREAGRYEVTFDASNLASGIYLYRLQAGSFVETKKMILLR